jgi:DNA repair exonuclease SbcCD nuclease subunit
MKYAIIGDLHLGVSDNKLFKDYQMKFFKQLQSDLKRDNIDRIIFLGDIFDNRKSMNIDTMYFAKDVFNLFIDYPIDILCGNHDVLYKNTNRYNSLVFLEQYDNISIHIDPTIKNGMLFVPWINDENKQSVLEAVKQANLSNCKYCFGHFEFTGYSYDKHRKSSCEEKITRSTFSDFKYVFSGHYHTKSIDLNSDNVIYTGAPYELTWVDFNDEKSYFVLDTQNQDEELAEIWNNNNRYFEQITFKEDKFFDSNNREIDINEIQNCKNIKIVTQDSMSDEVLEKVNSLDVEKLSVIDTNKVKLELEDNDSVNYQIEDVIIEVLSKDEDSERLIKLLEVLRNGK